MIDENDELELYNKHFNDNMKSRAKEIRTTMRCRVCYGSGRRYISPIEDYQGIDTRCYTCLGKGYVPITTKSSNSNGNP